MEDFMPAFLEPKLPRYGAKSGGLGTASRLIAADFLNATFPLMTGTHLETELRSF